MMRLNRFFLYVIACLTLAAPLAHAQGEKPQTAADIFINMPHQYIPQLETAWRKDIVDLFQKGKSAVLKNMMGGTSTLKKLGPTHLLLQQTERSQLELKLLPLVNHTSMVCMITTVYGPVADSRIAFYTTDWRPIGTSSVFEMPEMSDYYKATEGVEGGLSHDLLRARLDIPLMHLRFSDDGDELLVELSTLEYLDAESRKDLEPLLLDGPLRYKWNGSTFQKQK